jgi:hypothetical protein
MSWRENIREYINLSVVKTSSQHTSGAVFSIICFAICAAISKWLLPEGIVHSIAEGIEKITILIILIFLFVELLWHLFVKILWEQIGIEVTQLKKI